MTGKGQQVINLAEVGIDDVPRVGGENASLGEMLRTLAGEGVKVPLGFATTADAYWRFVAANGLAEVMRAALRDLKTGRRRCNGPASTSAGLSGAVTGLKTPHRKSAPLTVICAGGWGGTMWMLPSGRARRPKTCRVPASRASRRHFST